MTIVSRYLVAAYVRTLVASCGTAGLVLFLLELFEKAANLGALDAPAGAVAAYLALKIPKLLLDSYPATALMAVLLSLGLMARGNEILALRACGVAPWRILRPLLGASLVVSGIALAWAEYVVPTASTRSRVIRDSVIKLGDAYGGHEGTAIWVRSTIGFVRAEYFDAKRSSLHGVTVFQTDAELRLRRVVESTQARWDGIGWHFPGGVVKEIGRNGQVASRPLGIDEIALEEPPATFEKRRPKAKEMSYVDLSRFIDELDARGVAADEYRVERALKLAWPFTGVVAVMIGVPLAVRGGRRFGIGYNVATGLLVGFAYWFLFAIFAAHGRSGHLAPILAAWGANIVFAGLGMLLARRDA